MGTNLKSGDEAICVNAEGVEEYGIVLGGRYPVNLVNILPGQGEYVGLLVCEDRENAKGCQVIIVEASRVEKAYTLNYRIWFEEKAYALIDEAFSEEDHKDKEGPHADIQIVLPESKLEHLEDVLNSAVQTMSEV